MKELVNNAKLALPKFTRFKWVCIAHRLFKRSEKWRAVPPCE